MKGLMIPIFIFLVGVLGFMVYKDTETKKQAELNRLIHEASQPHRRIQPGQGIHVEHFEAAEN
ncbi:MAG: hypothetical protein WB445_00945 [Acinetobacter sp.]